LRRPAAYIDPQIRAAMSSFRALGDVAPAMAALASDLETGEWQRHYGSMTALDACELGYRLVVSPC